MVFKLFHEGFLSHPLQLYHLLTILPYNAIQRKILVA